MIRYLLSTMRRSHPNILLYNGTGVLRCGGARPTLERGAARRRAAAGGERAAARRRAARRPRAAAARRGPAQGGDARDAALRRAARPAARYTYTQDTLTYTYT